MAEPWLTIIGIGEDGLAGLSEASRNALERAEAVFGGERHLKLARVDGRGKPWPVPFDAACVLSRRGHPTAVLAHQMANAHHFLRQDHGGHAALCPPYLCPSCMDGPLSARAFLVFVQTDRGAVMYTASRCGL